MATDSYRSGPDRLSGVSGLAGLRGGLMVCGTASDSGKSFLVAGLCRLLARNGVRVAPFKAQNMANNAAVTTDGGEIGHAQWVQAVAAGVPPVSAMNPVLLKPTSDRTSQVVVEGRPLGEMDAATYYRNKPNLRPLVLDALNRLRDEYDVVICEGAGSPAEINLLEHDIVNLPLARAAGLPALVVGDIDRGGVFAALFGTVALLPPHLRELVAGFVVNKLRGDPALLGSATAELEARSGVPTLGVLPHLPGVDLDGEDSLTLDNIALLQARAGGDRSSLQAPPDEADREHRGGRDDRDTLDVAAVRWPLVANAGDLDPLRLEGQVRVRWVRSPAELGQPDLVVLPGSKATRTDLEWFRRSGLAEQVRRRDVPVVAICAGLEMCGTVIHDPDGIEGPPGRAAGLGWLPVSTDFEPDKVLDRPTGLAVDGPGRGHPVAGYRIHHGRVQPTASFAPPAPPAGDGSDASDARDAHGTGTGAQLALWLTTDDGTPLGWHGRQGDGPVVFGTTLHALFELDDFRADLLAWVATRAGKRWSGAGASFAATRQARLDRIADAIQAHLDLGRLVEVIARGKRLNRGDPTHP